MRSVSTACLIGSAALGLACSAALAQNEAPRTVKKDQLEKKVDKSSSWKKASDLLGMDVDTAADEDVGELEDFVFDTSTGDILFGVVSVGGFLGLGDTDRVVPWQKLALEAVGEELLINLTEDQVKTAPEFDDDRWPAMYDQQFVDKVHRQFQVERSQKESPRITERRESPEHAQQTARFARASELVEMTVNSRAGDEIGDVEDLIVAFQDARVIHMVLEPGESVQGEEKLFLIPASQMRVDATAEETVVVVNLDAERLAAMQGFDKDEWPDLDDSEWRARADREEFDDDETWVYRSYDTAFKSEGSGGWGLDGKYHKQYKPDAEETVSGRVTGVRRHAPMEGMAEGVIVTLKSDSDQPVNVHLAPAWYMSHQDEQVKVGDELEVTGCKIKSEDAATVIMAREIKKDGMKLTVRDERGRPYWVAWESERRASAN